MKNSQQPPEQPAPWNIFARELQAVLAAHNARLGKLNDRAGIHPQKVARLQHSLSIPRFNVLTPEELERVYIAFQMTQEEQLRIRAAILATAVEEMLMSRINNIDALHAADAILPIIQHMLHVKASPLAAAKGGPMMQPLEPALEAALAIIDRATIDLNLSQDAAKKADQVEFARQAHEGFIAACARLEALPLAFRENEVWKMWYAEAKAGILTAQTRLTNFLK